MTSKEFFTRLFWVSGATALAALSLYWILPAIRPYGQFIAITMVLFIAICIVLFWLGVRMARSSNRTAFNGLISASVFGKLVISLAFLAIYRATEAPSDSAYVLLFLGIYAIYTVYEGWFMTRLGRQ